MARPGPLGADLLGKVMRDGEMAATARLVAQVAQKDGPPIRTPVICTLWYHESG